MSTVGLTSLPSDVLRLIILRVPLRPRMVVLGVLSKRLLNLCRSTITSLPRASAPQHIVNLFPALTELSRPIASTQLPPSLTKLRVTSDFLLDTSNLTCLKSLTILDTSPLQLTMMLLHRHASSLTKLKFHSNADFLRIASQQCIPMPLLRYIRLDFQDSSSSLLTNYLSAFITRFACQLTSFHLNGQCDLVTYVPCLTNLTELNARSEIVVQIAHQLPLLKRVCITHSPMFLQRNVNLLCLSKYAMSLTALEGKRVGMLWYDMDTLMLLSRLDTLHLTESALNGENLARLSTCLTELKMGGRGEKSADFSQFSLPSLLSLDVVITDANPTPTIRYILNGCPKLLNLTVSINATARSCVWDLRSVLQRAQRWTKLQWIHVIVSRDDTCSPRNRVLLSQLRNEFLWLDVRVSLGK